ncbi:MAG: glycerol-3-phosphate dehydrogenase/oxidase [Acidobacteriota bacterium]
MFHPSWRRQALAELERPFDLVVLGGGITGCGILLDAAQRGLRVLLIERDDLASGTSSRSSKLIHGGLRYLKQLQLRVTRDSCRERDLQIALNPHLVTAQRWIYPSYEDDGTPAWTVELGLRIYDRLTRLPDKHRRLDPTDLDELAPGLARRGLDRTLSYLDARVDDARLTLAVAATGAAYGGTVLTRAVLEAPLHDAGGRLCGLVVRDLEQPESSGSGHNATHRVEAALIVNAAGVWVDRVRHQLGFEGSRVQPSRGSHLVLPAAKLPLSAAVTARAPDRRPVFFIPHPEGVLVGTTDLFHHGELDDPRPTEAEVDYLLSAVNSAFPDAGLGWQDVLGTFAGLRPVLSHGHDDPSKASREEAIWHERGLLSVAGGKLTTWRAMAEQVVDRALTLLPPERVRWTSPCATAGTPLAGLAPADLAARLEHAEALEPTVAEGLARRLGAGAWSALAGADGDPRELRPIVDGSDLCRAEVRAHLRGGAVLHLSDLLLRRVRLGMWQPALADELLPHLESTIRHELGWTAERWDAECARYQRAAEAWQPRGIVGASSSAEPGG